MDGSDRPQQAEAGSGSTARTGGLKWLVRGCAGCGALVAGWACYGFGTQVSGVLLGVVAAINGALFGALIAGTLADQMVSRFTRS